VESTEAYAPKRVLIVDDDPDIHQFLHVAFKDHGYHLESAFNGREGLTRIESDDWDLVISDVIMPEMDGLEMLDRVHKLRPELPVVVMTVDSTAQKIVTAIRDHAFAWLQKPFTKDAVVDLVKVAVAEPSLEGDIEVISAAPRWLELRLRCDMKTAWRALHFLREMDHGLLPEAERENVALAFREVLFNAVEHGGGNNPNVYVTVTYTRADKALLFRVRDPGPGFSFENLRHAAAGNSGSPMEHATTRAALGMRPGGFGILLIRNLVDELIYNEKGNEALLIRYVPAHQKT
jgi:two-component system, OmpR family, response regulator